jgi:hypothetical protein
VRPLGQQESNSQGRSSENEIIKIGSVPMRTGEARSKEAKGGDLLNRWTVGDEKVKETARQDQSSSRTPTLNSLLLACRALVRERQHEMTTQQNT